MDILRLDSEMVRGGQEARTGLKLYLIGNTNIHDAAHELIDVTNGRITDVTVKIKCVQFFVHKLMRVSVLDLLPVAVSGMVCSCVKYIGIYRVVSCWV